MSDLPGQAGKKRILIMDDEQIIRDVVGVMLQHLGYEAAYALNGEEAIAQYKAALASGAPFDGVIMDLTIPEGMGGKEAIGKLLEIDPNVRVLVSSGYAGDDVVMAYRKYGFRGVVNKPFNFDGLSTALARLFG